MRRPVRYERVSFAVQTEDAEWAVTASVRDDGGDTQLETAACSALSMDADEFAASYGFRADDLREACARADEVSRAFLFDIVSFLYNEAPSTCWGSPERVAAWLGGAP